MKTACTLRCFCAMWNRPYPLHGHTSAYYDAVRPLTKRCCFYFEEVTELHYRFTALNSHSFSIYTRCHFSRWRSSSMTLILPLPFLSSWGSWWMWKSKTGLRYGPFQGLPGRDSRNKHLAKSQNSYCPRPNNLLPETPSSWYEGHYGSVINLR